MTTAALGLIGVSEEETLALLRALAGVLFLGQVRVTRLNSLDICLFAVSASVDGLFVSLSRAAYKCDADAEGRQKRGYHMQLGTCSVVAATPLRHIFIFSGYTAVVKRAEKFRLVFRMAAELPLTGAKTPTITTTTTTTITTKAPPQPPLPTGTGGLQQARRRRRQVGGRGGGVPPGPVKPPRLRQPGGRRRRRRRGSAGGGSGLVPLLPDHPRAERHPPG